jgi:steroid delta-isomerase-like uncharacterized protein
MTNTETNKKIVTEFIDALFTRGDLGAIDAYLSEDFVSHDAPFGASADREGFRTAGRIQRAGFPDWHSDVHLLIAEDDLVTELFTASGTHRGEFMGVPATGRVMSLRGINIFRLRDGLITERWGRLDDLGFMKQLGLVES